jgi:hypothetical protein
LNCDSNFVQRAEHFKKPAKTGFLKWLHALNEIFTPLNLRSKFVRGELFSAKILTLTSDQTASLRLANFLAALF